MARPQGVELDPTALVAASYDRIGDGYAAWAATVRVDERAKYLAELCQRLPIGAKVLDLGCGSGLLTTARLAERFHVIGVDISSRAIAKARERLPQAQFLVADMTRLALPTDGFDAVVAFYSITHAPRDQHAKLLADIWRWLKPNGLFVASLGANATAGVVEPDWLGAPMWFSHFDAATNLKLVRATGLLVRSAQIETALEAGRPTPFLWVIAQKPILATSIAAVPD